MADILTSIHGNKVGLSAPNAAGKQSLIVEGSVLTSISQQAAITALTDSSGGTSGGNTVQAVPAVVAAATGADTATLPTKASVDATVTALKNDIATLTAKLNAALEAIKAAGVTL